MHSRLAVVKFFSRVRRLRFCDGNRCEKVRGQETDWDDRTVERNLRSSPAKLDDLPTNAKGRDREQRQSREEKMVQFS